MELSTSEEQQIESISFILVVLIVAVLPLIAIPKVVNTPVNTSYFLDISGYYKLVFLLVISMFMLTIMGFKAIARKQHIKLSLPLMLFFLWVIVSTFFAEDAAIAFTGYPLRWQGLLAYFCYAVVFTFVVNMLKPRYVGKVLVALFISAFVISVHSLLNYYGFEPLNIGLKYFFDAKITPTLSRGTLGNRNTAGAYFLFITIISLVMFFKNKGIKRNILFYLVLLFSYAGLLVSLTRIAWLGTLCSLAFAAFYFRKDFRKYFKKIIIVFVSFALVLVVLDITGGGQITGRYYSMKYQVNEAKNGNMERLGSSRFYIYGKAFKVLADNPIVGVGPDCFAYYSIISREEYDKHPELNSVGYFDKVHSEYLEYATTMGIPALIFYLWFIISIFIPWLRKKDEIKPEMLGIFIAWTGYLIQAAFNFGAISVLPLFFVLTGLLKSGLVNKNEEEIIQDTENEVNNVDLTCEEATTDNTDDKFSLT
uniref:O-antigen ligase family protein n=1 Tax=Acetivibrio cellulolyticus TaxID=35830 RepID=UPI0001E2DE6F|nr:O-antigen ligase family protein [Acetivibrio cellulolyticus]